MGVFMHENEIFERKTDDENLVSDLQSENDNLDSEEQEYRSEVEESSDEEDLDDEDEDDETPPEGAECEQCGVPAVISFDGLNYCEDCYQTQVVDGIFKD